MGAMMMLVMSLHYTWAQTYSGNTTTGKTCVFPFIYKNVSYTTCTNVDKNGLAWCATETDSDNHYISKKWGHCGKYCIITTAVIIFASVSVSGSYQTILRNIRYRVSSIFKLPNIRYCITDSDWLEWSNTSIPVCCRIGVIVDKRILQISIDVNNNCIMY